ncbi:hypothetical protein AMECASPLE_038341 [Ameca splendens]|uniref:Uncharacterized protein n=1 Tax=Ameca splendens TaxID=208324 RepID=A0ABV0YJN2_9TELE
MVQVVGEKQMVAIVLLKTTRIGGTSLCHTDYNHWKRKKGCTGCRNEGCRCAFCHTARVQEEVLPGVKSEQQPPAFAFLFHLRMLLDVLLPTAVT